jgi:hypothetical protein
MTNAGDDDYDRVAAAAVWLAERVGEPPPELEVVPAPDAFFQAMMVLAECNDIEPLKAFFLLASRGRHLSAADCSTLAVLLSQWHARLPAKPAKKAGKAGKAKKTTKGGRRFIHERWETPVYVATWVAEHRIKAIKTAAGINALSAADRAAIIEATAQEFESSWYFMRNEPPLDRARMTELLRGPKTRRL